MHATKNRKYEKTRETLVIVARARTIPRTRARIYIGFTAARFTVHSDISIRMSQGKIFDIPTVGSIVSTHEHEKYNQEFTTESHVVPPFAIKPTNQESKFLNLRL